MMAPRAASSPVVIHRPPPLRLAASLLAHHHCAPLPRSSSTNTHPAASLLLHLRRRRSLVVNASYVVDNLLAETEQGRALTAIGALDAGFEPYAFVQEMGDVLLPALTAAFFKLDMPVLRALCKDSALAQVKSVQGEGREGRRGGGREGRRGGGGVAHVAQG